MRLPEHIRGEIVAHALAVHPEEACGLLAVDAPGCVRRAYCLPNVDRSPIAFTVDPDGHFASLTDAESNGWALGGSFHSHPRTAAVPSRTDIAGALEPGWVHLIVGLTDPGAPELRAWTIQDGAAAEVLLEAVAEGSGAVACP